MKKQLDTRNGFTIIEVVLVLAIAGLIFLMVFIALPALQRSQRDTQRSNDVSRLSTAINNFKSNNRGNIPGSSKAGDGNSVNVTGQTEKGKNSKSNNAGTWDYFYDNYLLVGSAGQTDTFADPDGDPYSLQVVQCAGTSGASLAVGTACNASAQRTEMTFDAQSTNNPGHAILVVQHATCSGETSIYSSGARNIALLYKREGGGVICEAI